MPPLIASTPLRHAIVAVGLGLLALAYGAPVSAQIYSDIAVVSATMGVNGGRVCIGDGTRGDIGCPTYAPSVAESGLVNASSLIAGGLTVTGATSFTTISATVGSFDSLTVGGQAVSGGGGVTDRLVSGSSLVSVNSATGVVSFTQLGTTTAYLHPVLGFVGPAISATSGPLKSFTPVAGHDVATKAYVDSAVAGASGGSVSCEVKSGSSSAPACSAGYTEVWSKSGSGCTREVVVNIAGSGLTFYNNYWDNSIGTSVAVGSQFTQYSGMQSNAYNVIGMPLNCSSNWSFRVCCQ